MEELGVALGKVKKLVSRMLGKYRRLKERGM